MRNLRWMTNGLAAVVMMTAVAHADRAKHKEKYCSALSAVSAELAALEAMGPQSTVGELRTAVAKVEEDAKAVDKEARKIKTETSKKFVQSAEHLQKEMQSIPDTMTLDEARVRIDDELRQVKRNARALAVESGCPEAMPEQPK
jgi:hypothetical protein